MTPIDLILWTIAAIFVIGAVLAFVLLMFAIVAIFQSFYCDEPNTFTISEEEQS